jgi:hypothetical protein
VTLSYRITPLWCAPQAPTAPLPIEFGLLDSRVSRLNRVSRVRRVSGISKIRKVSRMCMVSNRP